MQKNANLPRILHVDDDQEFLLAFSLTFKDHFNITSFDNPYTALDLLKTVQFDLIITDHEMPDLNGIEFMKIVKQTLPNIPVVFLTGQGNEQVARDAFISGASDYYPKDIYSFAFREKLVNAIRNLIEKNRALEALKESEERNKSFLQHFQGVAFRLDQNFKPVMLNGAVRTITGYSKTEITTDPEILKKLCFTEDQERIRFIAESLLTSPGIFFDEELKICRKNGDIRWIHLMIKSISDSSGRTIAIQGSLYDITERKLTEQKLIEREKQEKLINRISGFCMNNEIQIINQAVNLSLAETGRYAKADRCYAFLFSEDLEKVSETYEWLNEGIYSQLEPTINMKVKNRFESVREIINSAGYLYIQDVSQLPEGFAEEDEFQCVLTNKSILIVPVKYKDQYAGIIGLDTVNEIAQWNDETVSLMRIVGEIIINTLERARAEKALKAFKAELEKLVWERTGELMEANEKLRETQRQQKALLDSIADLAWLKDAESHFIAVNESFSKACGFEEEYIIGKTDMDVWPTDLAKKYIEDDMTVMRLRSPKRLEEMMIERNGKTRWFETIKSPIIDDNGRIIGTAGIARDVTKRKQAEDILLKSRSEFEQKVKDRTADLEKTIKLLNEENARRIKIEQELVRRNRELANLAEMVMSDLKKTLAATDSSICEQINHIRESEQQSTEKKTEYLLSYVDNLLSLSSSSVKFGELETVNIEYLIRQVFNKYNIGPFNANLEISPAIPAIPCDPHCIERLFDQLISNSFKFRDTNKESLDIRINSAIFNDKLAIVYEDNGIGLKTSELPYIFEPGFKAHNRPGDGLGLSIAKRIVETHNGEISACSSGKNQGVRFTIKLPLPVNLMQ